MKNFLLYIFIISMMGMAACERTAETLNTSADFRLAFSSDSIKFDTVFTLQTASNRKDTITSIFKRLMVYNRDKNAVNIERIELANPAYTAIVNGITEQQFENTKLLGEDSLQILVSANINPTSSENPFLISDLLSFTTNGNRQSVHVVSWGQNANYLSKELIAENTTWTSNLPYILTDTVFVGLGTELTIESGARIYADHLAGLFIGGSLQVNGTTEDRVLFRNLRTGGSYDNTPGQWTGLIFGSESSNNEINNADIRNAINGIFFGKPDEDNDPDLVINSCKIENMAGNITAPFIAGYGILAFTSDIDISNTLINSCATSSVGLLAGGTYNLNHCTLANFSFNAIRDNPTTAITNFVVFGSDPPILGDLAVNITNSIIWGDLQDELLLSQIDNSSVGFNIALTNNIIKTNLEGLANNLLNKDPHFISPKEYNYHLDKGSPAIGAASASPFTFDLDGVERSDSPDIGCYEWLNP